MKIFTLITATAILLFYGCTSSKKTANKDNAFTKTFAALENNNTSNEAAKKAQEAYHAAKDIQLVTISNLVSSKEEARWDGLVNAYSALQQMYETVTGSACCSNKLTVQNYTEQLTQTRETAALYYYDKAESMTADTTTENIRLAYQAYKKVLDFVPDYRDAVEKTHQLFSTNSFIVAFNPVEDSSFFAEMVASSGFYTYSNNIFITNLIRELHTEKSSIPFLVLLPYDDCLKKDIIPDWLVDITIPELSIPISTETQVTYRYERQEISRDSTGRAIYANVAIPEYNNCDLVTDAKLILNVEITDAGNGNTILSEKIEAYSGTYRLVQCNNFSGAMQNQTMTLRERMAATLCANAYNDYKKRMLSLFEK
jgi:hypothetical protein